MNASPTDPRPHPILADPELLAFARRALDLARAGDAAALGPLLEAGLPVDLRSEKGDGLLMLAGYHGHLETARLLLAHGADPDLTNDLGQTPLAGAAFKGDLALAALLLDHGAAVDGHGGDGKTALMYAAMFDRVEVIDLLLDRGASPTAADATGLTARALAGAMGAARAAARLSPG